MPDPRLAYYGSRPDPNGRGTLVKTADGREALFLTAPGQAYTPGPAPTPPPMPVEAPARTGYEPADVTAMRHLAEGRAARERQDAAMAPLRLEDIARQRREGVAKHLGGVAPGSPEARVEEAKRVADRPGDAARTFARSAAVGALDTAALPVTLPARAARAAGVPGLDTVADLQADEALQDATWLATGEESGQYRKRVAKERADFPTVADAGAETGAGLVTAPLGAAATGLRRGIAAETKAAADFLKKHPKGAAVEALTHGSEDANRYLRKKAGGGSTQGQNPYTEARVADATTALEDAATAGHRYDGPVVRGLDLPEETLQDWIDRGAVRNESFWSTSADPAYLDDFFGKPRSGQKQVILRMQNSGGVPVSGVSLHPGETEVLIPPGRNWAIAGASEDDAGRTVLDLRRVESAPGAAISFSGGAGGVRIASSAAQAPAGAQQGAYARGERASDADIGASAALGAGMAGVTGAGARREFRPKW